MKTKFFALAFLVFALLSCKNGTTDTTPTVTSVSIEPSTANVEKGTQKQFTARVEGTNNPSQKVIWTVTGGEKSGTTIDGGLLAVASDETASTLTVKAVSDYDNSKFNTASVTVTGQQAPPTVTEVTITPSSATVAKGGTTTFIATVTGTNNPAQTVTWSVAGGVTETSITDGVLTVAAGETNTTLTVRATSTADTSKFGDATVTISSNEAKIDSVTINPSGKTMAKGESFTFTVAVTGTNNPAQTVTWSVNGVTGTTVTNGTLTVADNETATTLTVRATSTVDNSKYGEATVVVSSTPVEPSTVTSVVVSPGSVTLAKGESHTFTAIVHGTNAPSQAVNWTVQGASSSSINNNGILTVAAGETNSTLTVRATSTADTSKFGDATINVTAPPTVTGVTVTPSSTNINKGGTRTFLANVTGTNNPAQTVTWSVAGGGDGTSITNGVLTVAVNETATTLTVKAVSTVDNNKSGEATVTVNPDPATVSGVSISPSSATVFRGKTFTFNASVTGTNNPAQTVTWSVAGEVDGTSITNGVLTVAANETATTLTVKAVSTVDNSKSGEATVAVATAPEVTGVTVNVSNTTVTVGGWKHKFTAVVEGTGNPSQAVNWDVVYPFAEGTTIAPDGTLTLSGNETAETLTIRATSVEDPGKSGTIVVTVLREQLSGAVIIFGHPETGNLLRADTDNLKGSGTISYQWKRGDTAADAGTDIQGATSQTYAPVAADEGKYLKVEVKRAGNSGSITSEATEQVQAASQNTNQLEGTITISDGISNETVSISNAGALSVTTTGSITVEVNGSYQAYRWYVDGAMQDEQSRSLVIKGSEYNPGTHRILVIVYRSNVPYSKEILFTVN